MKKQLTAAAFLGALCTGGAYAQQYDTNYLTLDPSSAKIEELDARGGTIDPAVPPGPVIDPPLPPAGPGAAPAGPTIGETVGTIDQIVNLVEKIWNIIDKNRPVVNIAVNYANAVPYGTTHWTQLQSWSKPSTKKYAFSMKNKFGAEVVKVTYQVHWTHCGNLQGKGKFLTGVTVEPLDVTALWGYKVDLAAEVPDSTVANVGTHADPIASMQVQLKWKVSTTFQSTDQKIIYYVQGDGFLQELGSPFKKGPDEESERRLDELNRKFESVKF